MIPSTTPNDFDSPPYNVLFSTLSLTVPAGGTASFTVSFTVARYTQQQAAQFPIYSGFVHIRATSASQKVQTFNGAP